MSRFVALLVALLATPAWGQATRDVTIAWEAPANAADAGPLTYRLYRTPLGGPEELVDLGEPGTSNPITARIVGFLRSRSYALALTAVGPGGESVRSNAVQLPASPDVPGPPQRLRIVIDVDLVTGTAQIVAP